MPLLPSSLCASSEAWPRWLRITLTLALGALAAFACEAIDTPLPWMIGPLLVTALGSISGIGLASAPPLRKAGLWAIGTALGLYFTPQVVATVAGHAAGIVLGIVWALAMGGALAVFLLRANPQIAGLDRASVFFSSAIGGASEMVTLAERHGGRADLTAAAHSVRLLIVMLVVPFGLQFAGLRGVDPFVPGPRTVHPGGLVLLVLLTGAVAMLMERWRKPNPWVLGPLAVAALLTANGIELSALPPWMTQLGQLFIGVSLGIRFTPDFVRTAPRWLATVTLGTLVVIAANGAFAWLLAHFTGLHPATVLLGTAPGGMAEMCITAKVLQLGVPLVTAFHITRMVAVVLLATPLYQLWGYLQRLTRTGRA